MSKENLLFDPPPANFSEILQRDPHSAQVIVMAGVISALASEHEHIRIIGGLGIQSHTGDRSLHRRIEDVDIAIPIEAFDVFANLIKSIFGVQLHSILGSPRLYTFRSRPSLLKGVMKPEWYPQDALLYPVDRINVDVDIFVYTRIKIPLIDIPYSDIALTYPLPGERKAFYGIPLLVAPKKLIQAMKQINPREKDLVDLSFL